MIAGIVLAAGRSRRMGEPKAALTLRGRSFLERAVDVLREGGCQSVVVVGGDPDQDPGGAAVMVQTEWIRSAAAPDFAAALRRVVNPDPESDQLGSLRLGLRALPAASEAALVLPVDVPTADARVAVSLIDTFRRTGAPIVLPTLHGRHGHPVLFGREVWRELLEKDLPEGARSVIHADPERRVEVPVDALPEDVDTPEDYRRLLEDPRWSV